MQLGTVECEERKGPGPSLSPKATVTGTDGNDNGRKKETNWCGGSCSTTARRDQGFEGMGELYMRMCAGSRLWWRRRARDKERAARSTSEGCKRRVGGRRRRKGEKESERARSSMSCCLCMYVMRCARGAGAWSVGVGGV